MTKKLKAIEAPAAGDAAALATYNNTFSRYVAIKEEEATKALAQPKVDNDVDNNLLYTALQRKNLPLIELLNN